MKTKNLKKNLAIIFGFSVLFAACNGNIPESEIYIPPADLTSAEIVALLVQANEKLFAENEITTNTTSTYPVFYNDNFTGEMENQARKHEINFSAKKILDYIIHSNDSHGDEIGFSYYENEKCYGYSDMYLCNLRNMSTGFWKYSTMKDFVYAIPDDILNKEWKVENEKLVTEGVNYKYSVTLNKDKKYLSVKGEFFVYLPSYNFSYNTFHYSVYSYSANPQMPDGYQKSQFTAGEQCSMQVYWGENLGTDTYYSQGGMLENSEDEIGIPTYTLSSLESPKIAGKMPVFYFDAECTQLVDNFTLYYDSNLWTLQIKFTGIFSEPFTLYAQWEDLTTIRDLYQGSTNVYFQAPAKMPMKNYWNFPLYRMYEQSGYWLEKYKKFATF